MKMFDLSGRIAIVTGGNRGIGFSISRGLAEAGATVVIANRHAEEGEKAAASLLGAGLKAVAIPLDVTSDASIQKMTAEVVRKFGKIDILVNNAGIVIRKKAEDYTPQDWEAIMDTNLRGMFFCCQEVGREMMRQGKGKIINIGSVVSVVAQSERGVYAISKAGVAHLTRSLALEWAKYRINVNAIGPGATLTDINRTYLKEHPEVLQAFINDIPMGRIGHPDDCAGAAVFLASDASDFITGQLILIDGGMTIH